MECTCPTGKKGIGIFGSGSPIDWCYFTMEDTLLFGSLGLAILRHADRVKISCQSLLVKHNTFNTDRC